MQDDQGRYRKTRETFNTPGHAHELTFSCYRRLKLLSKDRTCLWFLDALDEARCKWDFELWAYVIMPEHAHVLFLPRQAGYRIERILKSIKQSVSRRAMNHLREHQPDFLPKLAGRRHGDRIEHHFWQPGGGCDRNVFEPRTAWNMVEYLHNNPVRRGLVANRLDYRWSSARFYAGVDGFDLKLDGRPPG